MTKKAISKRSKRNARRKNQQIASIKDTLERDNVLSPIHRNLLIGQLIETKPSRVSRLYRKKLVNFYDFLKHPLETGTGTGVSISFAQIEKAKQHEAKTNRQHDAST